MPTLLDHFDEAVLIPRACWRTPSSWTPKVFQIMAVLAQIIAVQAVGRGLRDVLVGRDRGMLGVFDLPPSAPPETSKP